MKNVSIVIPCRNEVFHIENCVNSCLKQSDVQVEVLVVDGMSEDGTRDVLAKLKQQDNRVKIIDNPEMLTPYAFNYGAKNAIGEFVQIVGSRNVLAPNYVKVLIEEFARNPEVACAGGDYQHIFENGLGELIALAMEAKFGVGSSNYRVKKERSFVDTVGVPLYKKSIFNELGYFDERLTRNQDDEFNYRLVKKGYKIIYNPEAVVTYLARGSFLKLFRQMNQYGYFKVLVNRIHRTVTTLRQLAPPLFVLYLLLGAILSLFSQMAFSLYLLGLVIYVIVGYTSAFLKVKNPIKAALMTWSFVVMHLGYGLGYLQGILDFILLKKGPSHKKQVQSN